MIPEKSVTRHRNDHYLLGVFAILTIFIFPSGRFFGQLVWHVINIICYQVMRYWIFLPISWIMPLITFISGASLFFALVIVSSKVIQGKMLLKAILTLNKSLLVAKMPNLFVGFPLAIRLEFARQLKLTHLNVVYPLNKLHKWNNHERFKPCPLHQEQNSSKGGGVFIKVDIA